LGDGVYFKLDNGNQDSDDLNKGANSDDEGMKTLQVFSKILTFGKTTLVLTTVRDMSYWLGLEKKKNMSAM
jgi:hypothetical protein